MNPILKTEALIIGKKDGEPCISRTAVAIVVRDVMGAEAIDGLPGFVRVSTHNDTLDYVCMSFDEFHAAMEDSQTWSGIRHVKSAVEKVTDSEGKS